MSYFIGKKKAHLSNWKNCRNIRSIKINCQQLKVLKIILLTFAFWSPRHRQEKRPHVENMYTQIQCNTDIFFMHNMKAFPLKLPYNWILLSFKFAWLFLHMKHILPSSIIIPHELFWPVPSEFFFSLSYLVQLFVASPLPSFSFLLLASAFPFLQTFPWQFLWAYKTKTNASNTPLALFLEEIYIGNIWY